MNNLRYLTIFLLAASLSITGFASAKTETETGTAALTQRPANIEKTADDRTEQQEPANTGKTLAATTPQPPLLEPEQKPSYEPTSDKDKAAGNTPIDQPHDAEAERNIGNTPQPPLIDTQQKPSYGPSMTDQTTDTENKKSEDSEGVSEQDQHQVTEEIEPSEPATEETIEIEQSTGDISTEATETDADTAVETEDEAVDKDATAAKEEKKKSKRKWTETYPVSVNADWLQLKSGEWLRGRIIVLQKDSLEFDSDELDDLVIEWENVKYLKSYIPYSLRFDSKGRTPVTGTIEIIGDKVHVRTDYDDKVYERSDLNTIASGKETEISYWKSKITFSINVRKGNTDQTDFTSKISAKRRTTNSRFILDYLGNFTKVENTETINNHRINQTLDYFLTRDLYWTPVFSEVYRDPFQNIERRLSVGIGIGYSLVNTNISEWNISAGPAYQETRFVSVQSDTDKEDSTVTLMLSTTFNTELNSKVDIEGVYTITLGDQETGGYTHHSLLTIETELTDKLDFDVTGVWDHVRRPVADKDSITPEQNDFRIMIGLGYDL